MAQLPGLHRCRLPLDGRGNRRSGNPLNDPLPAGQAPLQWIVGAHQHNGLGHGHCQDLLEQRKAHVGFQVILAAALQIETFFTAAVESHGAITPQRPIDHDMGSLPWLVEPLGKGALITVGNGVAARTEVPQHSRRRRELHVPGQPFGLEHPRQHPSTFDLGRQHPLEVRQINGL
ncbi:hypothetical protein D3C71_1688940 [compost metagenome]